MRLGIFLFYDREGQVSDHVVYLLAKFSEHIDRLIVMANGPFAPGEAERLAPYVDEVIIRGNAGFDVGGYKDGLLSVGFDRLGDYDEIVLFNYTVFGPIFPLAEMFGEMASRDIDFWGVTQFRDQKKEFIQSYFIVTRKSLHGSAHFREYWMTMPPINSVEDSIHFHEFRFTPFFIERGFRKSSFVENEEHWRGNTTLVDLPGLVAKRLPVIKYRAFNFEPLAIEKRGGLPAAENFAYLAEHTDYPVELVWDYIIRQTGSDQLIDAITQTKVTLDDTRRIEALDAKPACGVAVFLAIESAAEADIAARHFAALDATRIFVASSSADVVAQVEAIGWTAVQTARPYTGIPLAAFADRIEQIVSDEDVVLNLSVFTGEKDVYHFRRLLAENYWFTLAGSAATLDGIAGMFGETPRLGLLFAPTNAVLGRSRRLNPLCPRASDWAFDQYPADVAGATALSRWPWYGNAALNGRLARSPGLAARLAELHGQYKPQSPAKNAGAEGFLPELARRAGFVSALAVSRTLATKMAVRQSAEERNVANAAAEQSQKFNLDITTMRAAVDKAIADETRATAIAARAEHTIAALKADVEKAKAEAEKVKVRATAAEKQRLAALAQAEQVARRVEIAEASRDEAVQNARANDAALRSQWDELLYRFTPAVLHEALAVECDWPDVRLYLQDETHDGWRSVEMDNTPFMFGAISEVRERGGRINVKGWCYNRFDNDSPVFVAVTRGSMIAKRFEPCFRVRKGLRRKVAHNFTHEHSGFNISVSLPTKDNADDPLYLLVADATAANVVIAPLVVGEIRPDPAISLAPPSQGVPAEPEADDDSMAVMIEGAA